MCRASTAAPSSAPNAPAAGGRGRSAEREKEKKMPASAKERRPSGGGGGRPAFEGAAFDRHGMCLAHGTVRLAEQVRQDGRLLWKEVRVTCPKCAAAHHKERRVTSLGGKGKVKRGRGLHGTAKTLPAAAGRHRDKAFDTPFDDKGRCHHHPEVQMASKKVRGGWKILLKGCPKCIEANYDEESVTSGRSGRGRSRSRARRPSRGDDGSVDSRGSRKRSVKTRTKPVADGARHDKNGCCTSHPTIQIAKKKLIGGWKEYRECPKCLNPAYNDLADDASVGSRRSAASRASFRSAGTARSARSRKSARGAAGGKRGGRKGDRYDALPFDGDGFCHAHPGVRLAKKKALGGWKVLHDLCPDCARDASSQAGSARSQSQSSRGTGRYLNDDGSDASSRRSGRSGGSRRKKIRVKAMRYRDEEGKEGRYSGDVDEDHVPHGRGKMKYRDGSTFTGVWSAGSPAHGKSTPAKKVREGDGAAPKTVRKMKWMDYYGDPGEYTGEVDAQTNMPHGRGAMRYDHGLVQEGLWKGGRFVEGSDAAEGEDKKADGGARPAPKKPSAERGGRGDRRQAGAARPSSGGRGVDP